MTVHLAEAGVWRIGRNTLIDIARALTGVARVTALNDKGVESHAIIARDDIWVFDPDLAHRIQAGANGCELHVTLAPGADPGATFAFIMAGQPTASAV